MLFLNVMKRLMLLGILFCTAFLAKAQKVYFIYLQTEDASPFFVKMNNKVYSSNYSGYLILSNLVDSTYSFSVGPVPKGSKEPLFSIALNGNDKGYLIKNLKEYTGLFDLQSLNIVKPVNQEAKAMSQVNLAPRTDAFTVMLATSAGDSSLLYSQAVAKTEVPKLVEEKKDVVRTEQKDSAKYVAINTAPAATLKEESKQIVPEAKSIAATDTVTNKETIVKTEQPKVANDSVSVVTTEAINTVDITLKPPTQAVEPTAKADAPVEEYKRSIVVRHAESSTTEGFGLVFFDKKGEETDTIRLLIPNPKYNLATSTATTQAEEVKAPTDTSIAKNVEPVAIKKEEAMVQVTEAPKDKVDSVVALKQNVTVVEEPQKSNDSTIAVTVKVAVKSSQNLSCKASASDNDFFKLRKNMAAKESDDDMIGEAKKSFKKYCFTTEQIRNLSALFLTPSGKYQFFDAAYTHVSDPQRFADLESEIKDDYNLKRFKALIGE